MLIQIIFVIFILLCAPALTLITQPHKSPLVTVRISDVRGLLKTVSEQTSRLAGQANASDELGTQLGNKLGDPDLLGIPPETNAIIYVWLNGDATAYIAVSPEKIDAYALAINKNGGHASSASGLLAIASSKNQLKEPGITADVAGNDLQTTHTTPSITATMNVRNFLIDHEGQWENWISALQVMSVSSHYRIAETEVGQRVRHTLEQMAEVWFRTYLAILKQVDSVQLVLKWSDNGIRADLIFQLAEPSEPRRGVAEAENLLRNLPEGAVRSNFAFNPAGVAAFSKNLVQQVSASMGLEPAESQAWLRLVHNSFEATDGSIALSSMNRESLGYNATYAIGINSPGVCLDMLRQLPQVLKDTGLIGLYADAGVRLNVGFQENRRIYNGIPTHRLLYQLDISSVEQLPLGAMNLTDLSADVAIVDNVLLVAMGSASLDNLIDAAKSKSVQPPARTNAEARLDKGGRFYMDYNIIQAFSALGKVLPPGTANVFKNMDQSGATSSSLSVAGYHENNRYRVSVLFPTDLMLALKAARANSHTTIPAILPDFMEAISSKGYER